MVSITFIAAVAVVVCAWAVDARSPPFHCPGCYSQMDVNHPKVAEVAAYYLDTKGPHMMLDEILSASKQTVAGTNYKLRLQFHQLILCGTPMLYECTVTIYEDFDSMRSISDENCRILNVSVYNGTSPNRTPR